MQESIKVEMLKVIIEKKINQINQHINSKSVNLNIKL